MGFLNIFGAPREKGAQLYFRDDGGFIFRRLDIEDAFLVEKDNHKEIVKAWMMKYKLLKRFDGYKNIGAGMVTLSFGRDIIFDLFNQLANAEKPEQGDALVKDFVKKIAEAKCYLHEHKAKGSLFIEKLSLYLGFTMIVLALCIGLKVAF